MAFIEVKEDEALMAKALEVMERRKIHATTLCDLVLAMDELLDAMENVLVRKAVKNVEEVGEDD